MDGAFRSGAKHAAAGIVIMAYYPGGRRELLHRSGKVLGDLSSAFLAELLALDIGLQKVFFFMGW